LPFLGASAATAEFEVVEAARCSLRGQTLSLAVGKRISAATHGPAAIELLMEAGVKLREVVR
jgi:hypothetical protein